MPFPTGARPSPRYKLAGATPHKIVGVTPPQFAAVPKQLSMWGNNQYGDCVTAEEAFAKATATTEIFITDAEVIAWARQHGFLNGADLTSVMDAMVKTGFAQGGHTYADGAYHGVDFSKEDILQNALSIGPVKIGIDSHRLPSGAGNNQGWYAVGKSEPPKETEAEIDAVAKIQEVLAKQTTDTLSHDLLTAIRAILVQLSEDHCVGLCGYGQADWLYQQLNVPLPAGLQATHQGYLLFTWSTIGFVDHAWLMTACGEAWLRNPTSLVDGKPVPQPGPTPTPPVPPVPPVPPTPVADVQILAGTKLVVIGKDWKAAPGGIFTSEIYVDPRHKTVHYPKGWSVVVQ